MERHLDKASAGQIANRLFTDFSLKGKRVDFYGNPQTGELDFIQAGERPPEHFEYICTQDDGFIYWGIEHAYAEDEMEYAFVFWLLDGFKAWLSDLEEKWKESTLYYGL